MSTLGTREDFKHFLPRLLELAADPDPPLGLGLEPGGILMKLEYGECRKWPEAEQAALLDFFTASWRAALTVPGLRSPVGEWQEGIALLAADLTPFLRE